MFSLRPESERIVGQKVATETNTRHHLLPDIGKCRPAKAYVQTPDIQWNQLIGAAIQRAIAIVGLSNKEAAALVGVDDAEFGKWLSGTRRPQFDRIFSIEELRWPLVQCLAALDSRNELVTLIQRRSA